MEKELHEKIEALKEKVNGFREMEDLKKSLYKAHQELKKH